MADRRRRRRPTASESEHSETEDNKPPPKKEISDPTGGSDCESEGDQAGSEYESATEENEEDDFTYTEDYTDEDSSVLIEDEYIEDDWVSEERQSGDGEEQPDEAKSELDDDEDRKNPAFVPRKGNFYEHDTREGEEGGEAGEGEETQKEPTENELVNERRERKKKLWEEATRWDHDRYDDGMQAPKSRDELIQQYGYDIRERDQPPDAPPQRSGGPSSRGRRSENRPRFGEYMEGRFENPRIPKYGPKAVDRGGARSRGRGIRGRGRGGGGYDGPPRRGDSPRAPGGAPHSDGREQDERRSYSNFKSERRETAEDDWTSPPRPGGGNRSPARNRQDNREEQGWVDQGDNRNPKTNRENRNYRNEDFTPAENRRPDFNDRNRINNNNDTNRYGNAKPNQQQRTSNEGRQDARYSGDKNRRNDDNRQRFDNNRRNEQGDYNKEGPYSGNTNKSKIEEENYSQKNNTNRRRSKSPPPSEKQPPEKTGASLENIMDIAPPLTTIETRTVATVGNVSAPIDGGGGGGDTVGRKAYSQERRKNTGRLRQTDDRPEGQKKSWEVAEKPPRFREQEQAKLHQQQQQQQGSAVTLPPPAGAVNVGTASGKPPQADRPAPQTKRYSSQRQRNVADIDGGNHTPPPATGVVMSGVSPVQTVVSPTQTPIVTAMSVLPPAVPGPVVTQAPRMQIPMQVSSPMLVPSMAVPHVISSQIQQQVLGGALPVTISTSGPHPQMAPAPQYYVSQQTGQVFRQPAPVFRQVAPTAVAVGDPKSSVQYPPHLLQQQAIAIQQGSAQHVPQASLVGAPRLVYTAPQLRPAAHTTVAGGVTQRVIQAPPQPQYITATPMVIAAAAGPPPQHPPPPTRQQQAAHYQMAAAAVAAGQMQGSGQIAVAGTMAPGQVAVQFAVPPPVPQRTDVAVTSSGAKVGSGQMIEMIAAPPPPPAAMSQQGQISSPQGQAGPLQGTQPAQSPPAAQQITTGQQIPTAQVVVPPGPPHAIHVRGGTTYFNPQIQMYGMSPVRRTKEPIPIVSPQGTPERPESSDGDQDQAQFYEASESFHFDAVQQQYDQATYADAQFILGSPVESGSEQYMVPTDETSAGTPAMYPDSNSGTPTLVHSSPSSFENILKQSGSLDNIKEFRPQQSDSLTMSPPPVAASFVDDNAVLHHQQEEEVVILKDESGQQGLAAVTAEHHQQVDASSEQDNQQEEKEKEEEEDEEEEEEEEEDFHPYDDPSDESDVDFEEGIIASTEQTLNNSRGQTVQSPTCTSVKAEAPVAHSIVEAKDEQQVDDFSSSLNDVNIGDDFKSNETEVVVDSQTESVLDVNVGDDFKSNEAEVVVDSQTESVLDVNVAGDFKSNEAEVVVDSQTKSVLDVNVAGDFKSNETEVVVDSQTESVLDVNVAGDFKSNETEVVVDSQTESVLDVNVAGDFKSNETEVVEDSQTESVLDVNVGEDLQSNEAEVVVHSQTESVLDDLKSNEAEVVLHSQTESVLESVEQISDSTSQVVVDQSQETDLDSPQINTETLQQVDNSLDSSDQSFHESTANAEEEPTIENAEEEAEESHESSAKTVVDESSSDSNAEKECESELQTQEISAQEEPTQADTVDTKDGDNDTDTMQEESTVTVAATSCEDDSDSEQFFEAETSSSLAEIQSKSAAEASMKDNETEKKVDEVLVEGDTSGTISAEDNVCSEEKADFETNEKGETDIGEKEGEEQAVVDIDRAGVTTNEDTEDSKDCGTTEEGEQISGNNQETDASLGADECVDTSNLSVSESDEKSNSTEV